MSTDTGLFAVLTMRGIDHSKARLSGAVTQRERSRLNRWLLARTLATVGAWLGDPKRCIFVSACDTALDIADRAGLRTLSEPGGAGGHNHAAAVGSAEAIALGAPTLVMLPCDLPDLTVAALNAFVSDARRADFVIACDKEGPGTNALVVPAAAALRFFFGPGSCAQYVDWGRSRGWRVAVHASPELAFDIDTPADYAQWRSRTPQYSDEFTESAML